MGLLDTLMNGTGDAERDNAMYRGILAAGLQLMQAKGRGLFPALGQAGMTGLGAADQYRQQREAAQMRDQQRQMAQLQLQSAQREQQIAQLPGRFMAPGGGQAVDATGGMDTAAENPNNVARPEGDFDYQGYFKALRQYDPLRAARAERELNPPQDDGDVVLGPGASVYNKRTGQVRYQAPFKPAEQSAPSAVQEYLFAVQQGYKGSFEDWKKAQKPEGMSVNFGTPMPAINPKTGEAEFVRPDSKGGMTFTGVKPPPQNRDTKMPAEIQRMNIAADTMEQQLTRYEDWLKTNNPRDPTVQMSPARRAEMQSLMKNLQLQYKELAALGALTGPDLDLMEKALSDPFSMRGAFYGKDGLLSQIQQARQLVKERRDAMAKSVGPQAGQPASAPVRRYNPATGTLE